MFGLKNKICLYSKGKAGMIDTVYGYGRGVGDNTAEGLRL
jgi:hypothetical protein